MNANERVRVLHVIDSLDAGGAQTALLNLLRSTNLARYEPEVASMHGRGALWEEFAATGFPLHSLSPRKWLPLYVPRLVQLVLQRRYHIVHCHLFGANWIAKPLAALLRVAVRINHDQCNDALRYNNRLAFIADAVTNRFSTHICAVSASTRDFLIRRERLPPERVSLVYNGINTSQFVAAPARSSRKPFVVLGVGRLHEQKNFSLFLDVAAELLQRGGDLSFRIAGTGAEHAMLEQRARDLRIAPHVHFLGHVNAMPQLYSEADALLMTSRYEGTPLTVLEAMAMRLPVVVPRLDGLVEILDDGVNAYLCEPGARGDFVAALEKLIDSPVVAANLAEAGERMVRTHYSASIMAARVEAIYEVCLRGA